MARIDKIIDANKKLTIYELQGELSTEEMMRLNEEFYTGSSTRNIIFDVMGGSLKGSQPAKFKVISLIPKPRNIKRER